MKTFISNFILCIGCLFADEALIESPDRITSEWEERVLGIKYGVTTLDKAVLEMVQGLISEIFDETFIPKAGEKHRQLKEIQSEQDKIQQDLIAQVQKLQAEKEAILVKAQESEASLELFKKQTEEALAQIKEQKQQRTIPVALEFTEAQTRKHLIDIDLKEAGWFNLTEGRELEFPVKGMPISADNPHGNGYVDYVLWDDNGSPYYLCRDTC